MYAIRSYYVPAGAADAAAQSKVLPAGRGCPDIQRLRRVRVPAAPVTVITSYSIHYTKLYEAWL